MTVYSTPSAFTALHERTHRYVFKYVWGQTGGPQAEVEDITAEVYTRAWQARQRIPAHEKQAVSFLLTTARNLIIDRARRAKVAGPPINLDELRLAADTPNPERAAQTAEQIALLLEFMDDLPLDVRDMLVLRYALGWPVDRIAEHVGKSSGAVYTACHRAVNALRARWPEGENIA